MKNQTKIKYLAETIAFLFIFMIFISPTLASEITPNKVIELVNLAREKEGLTPLVQNDILTKVAQDKLDDMIKNSYFAHTSPSGRTPWSWFSKENYDYQYAGENLAINFASAEDQQEAWMESSTHRKNILNVNYQEIGVAFGAGEVNGKTSLITVQEFGARAIAPIIPQNEKNFLMHKKSNLLEDSNEIFPQVLAVKTKSSDEIIAKNGDVGVNLAKFWPSISTFLFLVAVLSFLGSILLLPISFLAVAFDGIYVLYEKKKQLKTI